MTRALPRRLPGMALLAAAATTVLSIVSRGKWCDAIVDSGTEWIYADSLSRGDLLYRDVVYWFGPFTPYFLAAFLRLLGSGFLALVVAGTVGSLATMAALFAALRTVTGRKEAALGVALAVPLLVFMPHSGGGILGMGYRIWHPAAFTLLAVALSVRPSRSPQRAAGIGALCGLAGLCRVEWGLAALGGVALAAAVRERFRLSLLRDLLIEGTASLIVFGGALGAFIGLAGPEAVLRDGHLLPTGLPPETRRFLLYVSGFHDPEGGLLRLLFSASLWGVALLLIGVGVAWREDPGRLRRRLAWITGLALFLILYADYAGSIRMRFLGVAPVIGPVAVVLGARRRGGPRSAALVAFGALALVLSYRRLFNIEDLPYVAPPMLFALVAGLGVLRELAVSERVRSARVRLQRWFRVALVALVVLSFSDRFFLYAEDRRVVLPGTQGMLTASPETARGLSLLAETIRRRTGPASTLVVIPEGGVLNLLCARRNPLRDKLYIPGYLSDANEERILADFKNARPSAVVIVNRETPEYGRRFFGKNYGRRLFRFIEENYAPCPIGPAGNDASALARLYVLRR